MIERLRVTFISAAMTWLFFVEYLPPVSRVQFWSDIAGYHQPLLSYTHTSVRDGRLPLWDPSIYCGLPFAANLQAAVFYPPNWLLSLAQAGRDGVLFRSIQILSIAHYWLAFVLGYLWLRELSRHWLPAVLGGGVVAFSGYMASQVSHLGVTCGYAWIPLGLWGIAQASRTMSWRPLWKLSLASAMCFLAGYPSTWIAFCAVAIAYALALPGRSHMLTHTAGALLFSLGLAAVTLLPAAEAMSLKEAEYWFGAGVSDSFLSYLLPNYYDQNRRTKGPEVPSGVYLYLGAPALFALLWTAWRPRTRWLLPAASIATMSFWVMLNPGRLLDALISAIPRASDAVRQFNFLLGPTIAAAVLVAGTVDDCIKDSSRTAPRRSRLAWITASLAWSAWLLYVWPREGVDFPVGLRSGLYAVVTVALFTAGILVFRSNVSPVAAAVLVFLVFAEYKAFGTNRAFNAVTADLDAFFKGDRRVGGRSMIGVHDDVYQQLLREPWYRLAILNGPASTDMRYYRLATPQGEDPLVTTQYKVAVEEFVKFHTKRLFDIDPRNLPLLDWFGVKFIMVVPEAEAGRALQEHPDFVRLEPANSFFQTYAYRNARPSWRFDGDVEVRRWTPEDREFEVSSTLGGEFGLIEQLFPGWRAYVDGREVPIRRWRTAFQSIDAPAGRHWIRFAYRPSSFRIGATVSLLSLLGLIIAARKPVNMHPPRRSGSPQFPHWN